MHWQGLAIGLISLLLIGVFHPVVIKGEYYFGVKLWILFLLGGIAALAVSVFIANPILSATFGVLGFTMLWCILEIFEQRRRVEKGWFPKGPSHHRK